MGCLSPAVSSAYVANELAARVRMAYPGGTYQRLQAVKRSTIRHLFRLNQNIDPRG